MIRQLSFDQKYEALVRKDRSYEGLFITAVKTTGIFCRPGCTARTPKRENVEFFATTQEAIQNGYRPCKVCKPMEDAGNTPAFIQSLINELNNDPFIKIKDYQLRQRGLEPSQVRRWFKKNHNITFHAYQRMLRINNAFQHIKNGKTVTETAFSSGYESLSGFNESYKNIFKANATEAKGKTIINISRFTTPIGPMYGCATEKGVCLVEFTDRKMLETEFKDLCKRLDAVMLPGANPHLEQLEKELMEYFAGERKEFSVKLDTPGTPFQQQVWEILHRIPYGETWSYKQQAIKLDNLKAIRAVASANGMNRIAIIIPCHRVIGENGHLTGYGGGLPRKKWLLDHEMKNSGQKTQSLLEF
jgi:AraC family transcriptional regulator, regulatory protein of adaptative response / methylated-DNA-[protein]-cysteine methyltransferase